MKKYIFPTIIAVVLLGYQNCSDVSFQTTGAAKLDGPTDEEIQTVNRLCNTAGNNLRTMTFSFTFENPIDIPTVGTPACKWNQNGNINKNNEFMTARHEQRLPMVLPPNSDICGATFQFIRQEQQYDDQFFFIMNNKVIASNALFAINNGRVQKSTYNLGNRAVSVPHYDWSNLVNTRWPNNFNDASVSNANNFCLGRSENLGSCSWPITEKDGDISMSFDPSLMRAVGLEGLGSAHEVGFVITGDNDESSDCQHKPVSFSLTVQFITR